MYDIAFTLTILLTASSAIWGLFLFIFRKGQRKKGFSIFVLSAISFVVVPLFIQEAKQETESKNQEIARSSGFSNYNEYSNALKAGITDPKKWTQEKALRQLNLKDRKKKRAEIAAKEKAAHIAKKAAERQAKHKARYAEHLAQLDREIASIPKIKTAKFTADNASITSGLLLIGAWALLYEDGEKIGLNDTDQKKRQKFRKLFVAKQAKILRSMRDAFGPVMRRKLWETDASARTFGTGYRTVEFVSYIFARNANIKEFHTNIKETLIMLRFTRAEYKWVKNPTDYSYYEIDSPKDTDIVIWGNNREAYRVIK